MNFVRQLCDASLLAANVSQLRAVLDSGSSNRYYIPLLVMITLSILAHILFGILMIIKGVIKNIRTEGTVKNTGQMGANDSGCCKKYAERLYEVFSLVFMLIVVILNVAIAGLGLSVVEC